MTRRHLATLSFAVAFALFVAGLLPMFQRPSPAAGDLLYGVNVNSGESLDYGSQGPGTTNVPPTGSEQTVVQSTGLLPCRILIQGGAATRQGGGGSWTAVESDSPGANQYSWKFVKTSGGSVWVSGSSNVLMTSLLPGTTVTCDTQLDMPSSYSSAGTYTFTATVSATAVL